MNCECCGKVQKYLTIGLVAALCVLAGDLAAANAQSPAEEQAGREKYIYVSPSGDDSNPGTRDRPLRTGEKAASLATAGTAIHFLPAQKHVYVSPSGDDGALGTRERPVKSVEKAAAAAKPGTVIHLLPGIYPPIRLTGICGTEFAPIIIRGEAPLPLDFTETAALGRDKPNQVLNTQPIRKALRAGAFSVGKSDGLAVVEGKGRRGPTFSTKDCAHLVIENLVMRNGRTNLRISGNHITVRRCAVHGGGSGVRFGAAAGKKSRFIRLERVVAYDHKSGGGFDLAPRSANDVECIECVSHSNGSAENPDVQSDGFSFPHYDCRFRIKLLRCLSLNNWSDGFDLGIGVGGMVLEFCIADGNGKMGYGFKDFKVRCSQTGEGHTFRYCRGTDKIIFTGGRHVLKDFKTGERDPELE